MTKELAKALSVPVAELRRACEAFEQPFERSDELPAGAPHMGQKRAVDAIRFGIDIDRPGYNVYVLGTQGSHRHGLVNELIAERAKAKGAPDDWCYVNNFTDPERPQALSFSAGRGAEFRDDMHALIEDMRLAIPSAFEGDDYRNQLRAIEETTQKEVQEQWQSLEEHAASEGIGVLQTSTGYVLAPVEKGKVLGDKEFDRLPEARRKKIQAAIKRLSEELQARIEQMPALRKQHRERVKALNQEVTAQAVSALISELRQKYEDMPKVTAYLDTAEQNIIENAQDFQRPESPALPFLARDSTELFAQYEVNLVVDNSASDAAPIIYEPNPSHPNVIGKIEHRAEMGALLTDFRMVRSGSLLQANGGYLILDIQRVLTRPFTWESLKQALLAKSARIESPADTYGLVTTTTLKPEPIPLDLKVILIGERWLFYLLNRYDHEFENLFKVAADFENDIERNNETVREYASLVADSARANDLLPLSHDAMRKVIEQRARRAQDGEKLSLHMRSLDDLLIQSDYWARKRGSELVEPVDIKEAIDQRDRRLDRSRARVLDAIRRNILLIDTEGTCVGQVNGLSVIDLGEFRYGHPVRITATTRMGTGELVDIEREVKLGGAIHSKGMLILSAALTSRYSPETPLSLHGSVVFEQSYGGVEGDSASVGELCALISSLSRIPIKQNIAVTGSINQLGRIQVVGGINEKIEGFFDVCSDRGLDGSHGVVIPRDNIKHLMLREDVTEAVRDGRFHVFAATTIDEAVALLTGVPAGERGPDGRFAHGSVNSKVEEQLIRYATLRKRFGKKAESDEQE
jgi:predicted ATP-dependent protease